jgi:hypothetical protein
MFTFINILLDSLPMGVIMGWCWESRLAGRRNDPSGGTRTGAERGIKKGIRGGNRYRKWRDIFKLSDKEQNKLKGYGIYILFCMAVL